MISIQNVLVMIEVMDGLPLRDSWMVRGEERR
jgi:hypothetical protein